MKTVSTDSASAAELETPHSMDEAMETGFLPDDEHYRLTGEFKPEKKDDDAAASSDKDKSSAKQGASAAATENETQSEIDDASAASSSKAAASETASPQREEKPGTQRENRWQKRERELKELREKVARLESKPQTEQQRSESQQTTQSAAAETRVAKVAKPKLDDVDPKTGKPMYKNFAEYEDAKDTWLRQETIREFQEASAKTAREQQQSQADREIGISLNKKFETTRAKYKDFDQVALNKDLVIPKGSVVEGFLLDSDHSGEVVYYLGHHPEILLGFYKDFEPKTGKFTSLVTPQQQFRKLMAIEAELTGSSGSASGAASSAASSSSARPVTQASRPPHQVSGKGTVAKDSVEQALEDGDFETYQRAQNAKELDRRKKA